MVDIRFGIIGDRGPGTSKVQVIGDTTRDAFQVKRLGDVGNIIIAPLNGCSEEVPDDGAIAMFVVGETCALVRGEKSWVGCRGRMR